jgi:hypothetical protein
VIAAPPKAATETAPTNAAPPGEIKAPAALGVDSPPTEANPAVAAAAEKEVSRVGPSIPAALFQNLVELERQRMKLEGRLAELSTVYKARHPAVAVVQAELNEVLKTIQFQVRIARDMQRAEVLSLEGQLQAATAALQEAEGSINDKSLRLLNGTALSDDLERVRAQYNAMLGQLMKLDVASGFRTRIISILEPALVEGEPVYPKKMKGLMVAAFFGLGLGLALAFFIEYIDDSIKMAEEVERDLQLPFLGMVPANPAELLLGWRLKELLDWAKKHYDRIIIDSPPIMGIADGAILGSLCDGALFVIWAGRTSRRYVRVAKATAVSRGARLFGFILNNLEPGRVGYYHYYPYYYSYYSRGYYYAHKDEDEGKGGDFKDVDMPSPDKKGKDEIQDVY